MSKYDSLWNWIKNNGTDKFSLTFAEIEKIAGVPLDHSFLTMKKELIGYGFKVGKISMKEQRIMFEKNPDGGSDGSGIKGHDMETGRYDGL